MDSEAPLLPEHGGSSKPWNLRGTFAASLGGLTAVLLALLAAFGRYSQDITDAHVNQYYRCPLP